MNGGNGLERVDLVYISRSVVYICIRSYRIIESCFLSLCMYVSLRYGGGWGM